MKRRVIGTASIISMGISFFFFLSGQGWLSGTFAVSGCIGIVYIIVSAPDEK